MVSSTDIHNLTNMLGRCGRELERIADALERMSSGKPKVPSGPPRGIPTEGPNVMEQDF
ncbi:hypothetical protein GCM10023328_22690 [Modestobacter marinus]|uniref:Uncharacterized protein n=1 Tax=Modestobacter marinus TaxID=477641 RepID=A0A846M6S6_9ACTN|nr:hypothetical protein [Modestobacter marinus]GGL84319.1 hypothetical protein GCM10011589_46020 [Modestobacter marinus]